MRILRAMVALLFVGCFASCSDPQIPQDDAGVDADTPTDSGQGDADDSAGQDAGRDADDARPVDGDLPEDSDMTPADADADSDVDADADTDTDADMDADADSDADDDGDGDTDADDDTPSTVAECFEDVYVSPSLITIDYDVFSPIVGSHCLGTNHQDIEGIERVVFVGDSVTVGSPPTIAENYYRNILAHDLATHFGLTPPGVLWETVNLIDGVTIVRRSGDFSCCAEWGARTDDLMRDDSQIEDCLPEEDRHLTTLVVITIGGNDIASITEHAIAEVPTEDLWDEAIEFVDLMRNTMTWLTEDPTRFPGGLYVVFANMFEFTDGTGDVTECPAAGLAGFGADVPDPEGLADIVIWANSEYMSIAVDTGTDMIFMLEEFCGHGWANHNPDAPCYRGPDIPRWFDITCIHPNPTGHSQIADMFLNVILE